MPDRTSKKRPRDINQLAAQIVREATTDKESEPPKPEKPAKNPAAVELGRLGGLKGGKARAAKMTPEERRDIAKKAAQKRWSKSQAE